MPRLLQVPDAKRVHCASGVCRGGLEDDLSIAEDKDVVALNFLRRAGKLSPAEQHGVWSDNFVRRHHTLCGRQYRWGCEPDEELADLVLADEGAGGCDETWWRDENGVGCIVGQHAVDIRRLHGFYMVRD